MKLTTHFCKSSRFRMYMMAVAVSLMSVFYVSLSTGHAEQAAEIYIGSTNIHVTPAVGGVTFMSLRVVNPEGEMLFDESNAGDSIQWVVPLWAPDGRYKFEVRVGFGVQSGDREENDQPSVRFRPWVQSGTVSIQGGAIVPPTQEEGSLLKDLSTTVLLAFAKFMDIMSTTAFADQVILDDMIIDGCGCVGLDCVNGESFGFDTVRLKENNLRLHFDDTSSSASFPKNDWRIVINDQSNGGDNFFAIEDSTAGRQVFRVDAGAPADSLHIDAQGDVGIGTSAAVMELHVVDGDTPTMRLEQDGSSGWNPQTWDVAGNETSFFVRDLTGGSKLPFRIRPGAPTSSIDIAADGDVGIGTSSPNAKLDIRGTATASFSGATDADDGLTRMFEMSAENTNLAKVSDAGFLIENAKVGFQWVFRTMEASQGFSATKLGTGGPELEIKNPSNDYRNVTLLMGNGAGCANGQWLDASSRDYKENIKDITPTEAMKTLADLKPVKYIFKKDASKDLNVGFIAEDVPELVATKDRKSLSPLEIVAVLTKVVQEQQELIMSQKKEFNEQRAIITKLTERLNILEEK